MSHKMTYTQYSRLLELVAFVADALISRKGSNYSDNSPFIHKGHSLYIKGLQSPYVFMLETSVNGFYYCAQTETLSEGLDILYRTITHNGYKND